MITEEDIKRFTNGYCYPLACEIERQSNGEFKLAWVKKIEGRCGHAFCITKDRKEAIDVEGKRPLHKLLIQWRFEEEEIETDREYAKLIGQAFKSLTPTEEQYQRAQVIAKELINETN